MPAPAIVPDGDFHPRAPLRANEPLREKANQFWLDTIRPWILTRTAAFREEVPRASVIELDSPNHHISFDKEDETVRAIEDFLSG
ncbi:MAG TPA: hypothetical protein VFI27_02105 [candidate division Zixibacteria bacterium]|nr:hypothetical protein [candidate division Zixibacteria bacterium]